MSEILKEKVITKGNFNFIETKIKDLYIIEPKVFWRRQRILYGKLQ